MDPVGIAGLTIAVLDQLWKIGNGTAELISNYRDFDNDTKALEDKIRDENNRTKALRMLLLDPCSTYGGESLFEQFDVDVQEQIHIFLEQASDVLDQAHQLMHRRQRTEGYESTHQLRLPLMTTKLPRSSVASPTSYPSVSRRPRSLERIRWSLLDKKRVETIVAEFSELNCRIHESIKLWCLGTSIGVDLRHLRHLEKNHNSQILGFDVDARLQIATSQAAEHAMSLEVSRSVLIESSEIHRVGDKFGIIRGDGQAVLLEYRSYSPEAPVPVELDDRTRDLIDKLANLLHQPKEIVFRTPNCVGWFREAKENKVAYIFNVPEGFDPSPISLLDVLKSKDPPAPSLSQRFWLALRLSKCISQLQLVKWVHESFRSENILFFPSMNKDQAGASSARVLDFSEPWVLGFEFSRPETYFSHGHADTCLTRDVYRHPDRQQRPTQLFSKIHDIYALGVVLLEIGLWQPALSLDKDGFASAQNPQSIKKHLLRHAEKRLGVKMGTKYQGAVIKCLTGDFDVKDDNKEDLKLQQAFRSDVVDVLQRAADSI
ncbi:uncharacterized protein C8A04DRAFT_32747 [Dichotomopilus funicola]|uniref:Protein kinase domain-containing protein n=1 Tax=Dichotomopilus funicola TaxID=1934379 RepID=A0AAN6UV55_9PEZI|nr:hypothetical protein C8A04DRAFT_32747 [Dichotomopilus funicola]